MVLSRHDREADDALASKTRARTVTLVRSLTPARASGRRVFSPLRRLFLLSPREADFATRGFVTAEPTKRDTLEAAGRTFIAGYNVALLARAVDDIMEHIATVPQAMRGLFAEGAAMGVAIADGLSMRKAQLAAYLDATERDFTYLAHVGAGWALARMPWRRRAILKPLDTLHGWLAYDGLGFHDAYFHPIRVAGGWRRETQGYAARVYDQGIGRALWFVSGGDVTMAARRVAALDSSRHLDLWSGLGLAMAYAGPAGESEFAAALDMAEGSNATFAQGIAFACEARMRARHVPPGTDHAARAVWSRTAEDVAELVRRSRARLPDADGQESPNAPRYELWRDDIAREWRRLA
jgi:hypothetical protein